MKARRLDYLMKKYVTLTALVGLALVSQVALASYRMSTWDEFVLRAAPYAPTPTNSVYYVVWEAGGARLSTGLKRPIGNPLGRPGPTGTQLYLGGTQCVAAVRALTGAPASNTWRRGRNVMISRDVPPGTAIATFVWSGAAGRYVYSGHATTLIGIASVTGAGELHLWSQNWPNGFQVLVQHRIRSSNGGVADPRRYYVVE